MQYDVYRNPSPHSSDEIPYLLDVQAGLLEDLATRVIYTDTSSEELAARISMVLEQADIRMNLATKRQAALSEFRHGPRRKANWECAIRRCGERARMQHPPQAEAY